MGQKVKSALYFTIASKHLWIKIPWIHRCCMCSSNQGLVLECQMPSGWMLFFATNATWHDRAPFSQCKKLNKAEKLFLLHISNRVYKRHQDNKYSLIDLRQHRELSERFLDVIASWAWFPPNGDAVERANKGWTRVSVTWLGFCVQCAAVWKISQIL